MQYSENATSAFKTEPRCLYWTHLTKLLHTSNFNWKSGASVFQIHNAVFLLSLQLNFSLCSPALKAQCQDDPVKTLWTMWFRGYSAVNGWMWTFEWEACSLHRHRTAQKNKLCCLVLPSPVLMPCPQTSALLSAFTASHIAPVSSTE